MKRALGLAAAAFLLGIPRAEAGLRVTGVSKEKGAWIATFSEKLEVSGIEYKKPLFSKEDSMALPLSGNKRRRFANIRIVDESLYLTLLKSLREKLPPEDDAIRLPEEMEFEITDFNSYQPSSLGYTHRVANVEVVFENALRVNFGVMITKKKLWIAYPSVEKRGKYARQFTILDENLRERVESEILELYRVRTTP